MSGLDYQEFKRRIDTLIAELLRGFRERYGYDPGGSMLEPARSGEDSSVLLAAFGSLFVAQLRRDSPVYLLPPLRIRDGRYIPWRGTTLESLRVAGSFCEFIEHLITELEQAVRPGGRRPFG